MHSAQMRGNTMQALSSCELLESLEVEGPHDMPMSVMWRAISTLCRLRNLTLVIYNNNEDADEDEDAHAWELCAAAVGPTLRRLELFGVSISLGPHTVSALGCLQSLRLEGCWEQSRILWRNPDVIDNMRAAMTGLKHLDVEAKMISKASAEHIHDWVNAPGCSLENLEFNIDTECDIGNGWNQQEYDEWTICEWFIPESRFQRLIWSGTGETCCAFHRTQSRK